MKLKPLTYQMFMCFSIILSPLLSRIILKKSMFRHVIIGIIVSLFGIITLIVTSLIFADNQEEKEGNFKTLSLSYVFIFLGCLLMNIQKIYDEWIFDKVVVSSYRFIGLEGWFGMIFLVIAQLLSLAIDSMTGE